MTAAVAARTAWRRWNAGRLTPEAAAERLATLPFEDLGHTRVDHHRSLRTGLPEVIYAAGKTTEQTVAIFASLAADGVDVLATRVMRRDRRGGAARRIRRRRTMRLARTVSLRQRASGEAARARRRGVRRDQRPAGGGRSGGHGGDLWGAGSSRFYDVGVAGLHRLLAVREELTEADVVIVCAGMEGALPSVVGGLVGVPVIAVPTSVDMARRLAARRRCWAC